MHIIVYVTGNFGHWSFDGEIKDEGSNVADEGDAGKHDEDLPGAVGILEKLTIVEEINDGHVQEISLKEGCLIRRRSGKKRSIQPGR